MSGTTQPTESRAAASGSTFELPVPPPVPDWPLPDIGQQDHKAFDDAARHFREAICTALTSGDDGYVARVAAHLLGSCPAGGLTQVCQLVHWGKMPPGPEGREVLFEVGLSVLRAGARPLAEDIGRFLATTFSDNARTGPHGDHLLAMAFEPVEREAAQHHLRKAIEGYRARAMPTPTDLQELKLRLAPPLPPDDSGGQKRARRSARAAPRLSFTIPQGTAWTDVTLLVHTGDKEFVEVRVRDRRLGNVSALQLGLRHRQAKGKTPLKAWNALVAIAANGGAVHSARVVTTRSDAWRHQVHVLGERLCGALGIEGIPFVWDRSEKRWHSEAAIRLATDGGSDETGNSVVVL